MAQHEPGSKGSESGKRWNTLYAAVIGFLVIQIVIYYVITVVYK